MPAEESVPDSLRSCLFGVSFKTDIKRKQFKHSSSPCIKYKNRVSPAGSLSRGSTEHDLLSDRESESTANLGGTASSSL